MFQVIKPYWYFAYVTGSWPFILTNKSNNIRVSAFGLILTILVLVFCSFGFTFVLSISSGTVDGKYKIVAFAVQSGQGVFIPTMILLKLADIKQFLNNLIQTLYHYEKLKNVDSCHDLNVANTIVVCLFTLQLIRTLHWLFSSLSNRVLTIAIFCNWSAIWPPLAIDSMLIILLALLLRLHKQVNQSIDSQISVLKRIERKQMLVFVNEATNQYWYLGELVLKFSSCFGLVLLVSNFCCLTDLTVSLSNAYLLHIHGDSSNRIVKTYGKSVLTMTTPLFINYLCTSIIHQRKITKLYLQKLVKESYLDASDKIYNKTVSFHLQNEIRRQIEITACGLFKVNNSLSSKIISTVVTYLMFMVQIKWKQN